MLQPLPTELFFEIARYLDHADLKAARLACKALAVVTAPFLFRRLVIVFRSHSFLWDEEASFRRRHSFLKALAERRTHLGRHVKSLRIAEPFDAYRPPKTITNLPQRALKLLTPKRYRKRDFSEGIVKLLCRALPYLESLYELDWGSSRQGVFETTLPPKRLEHAIQLLKVLSTMPSIRELSISIHLNGLCFYEQYFLGFRNLTRLCYSGDFSAKFLPAIISSSPKLRVLTLRHGDWLGTRYNDAVAPDVAVLFPICTEPRASLVVLDLQSVVFSESAVPILIPYIRHLCDLCIRDTAVPALFWRQLGHDQLWVLHLDLRRVVINEHVLRYLSKYRGLRDLRLEIPKDGMVEDEEQPETWASRFWFDVLPKHSHSLTSLVIISQIAGHWCIDGHALDMISQCRQLRDLLLTIDWARTIVKGDSNIIRCILKFVSHNTWPHLRRLGLFSVLNEVVRHMAHPKYHFTQAEDYGAYKIDETVGSVRFRSWSRLLDELVIMSYGFSWPYTFRECEDSSGEFAYYAREDGFRRGWTWVEEAHT